MTIQFQGHVVKCETGSVKDERMTIHCEMSWVDSGDIMLNVPIEIAKHYRPGDPIQVTVIPLKKSE